MKSILATLLVSLLPISVFAATWSDMDQKTFVIPTKDYCWVRLNVAAESGGKSTIAFTFEAGKVADADPNFDRICKLDKGNFQFTCVNDDVTKPCQGKSSTQDATSMQISPKGALMIGFRNGGTMVLPPLGRTQCVEKVCVGNVVQIDFKGTPTSYASFAKVRETYTDGTFLVREFEHLGFSGKYFKPSEASLETANCISNICVGTTVNVEFDDVIWKSLKVLHIFENGLIGIEKDGLNIAVDASLVRVK